MLGGNSMSIKLKPLKIASVLALSVTLSLSSMGVAAAAPLPSGISAPFAVSAATKKITTYRTTVNVNLRKGAGTEHQRIATIKKGTKLTKTGKTRGKWWQVRSGKHTGWLSSSHVKSTATTLKPAPKTVASPSAKSPAASTSRWTTGIQPTYDKPSFASKRQKALQNADKVKLIQKSGKWSQVRTPDGKGWILSSKLVTNEARAKKLKTAPSKVTSKMTANTNNIVKRLKARYAPSISTVYGPRSGSIGHSSGLAADVMIKGYAKGSGIKAGDQMARYLTDNHEALGINYLIWRDQIWLSEDQQWGPYSKGGWGKHLEKSRGWNPTTRHMDHIHVETFRK